MLSVCSTPPHTRSPSDNAQLRLLKAQIGQARDAQQQQLSQPTRPPLQVPTVTAAATGVDADDPFSAFDTPKLADGTGAATKLCSVCMDTERGERCDGVLFEADRPVSELGYQSICFGVSICLRRLPVAPMPSRWAVRCMCGEAEVAPLPLPPVRPAHSCHRGGCVPNHLHHLSCGSVSALRPTASNHSSSSAAGNTLPCGRANTHW
jgi:hypothetical protein